MSMKLRPLSAAAFQPFGDVLDPAFEGPRVDHAARLQNSRADASHNLMLVRSAATGRPHMVARMERHPFSSQTFIPLQGARAVLAVALDNGSGAPDLATVAAYVSEGQGFSYHAGVWHIPLATLDEARAFAVFMYTEGTPDDTHWADVTAFDLR